MRIITISGLDGSGKSTQIELLKKYLKESEKSFYYFHGTSSSISSLYEIFPIFSWKKTKDKTGSNSGVTKANWIEIQLRKIALLIDIFRFRRLMKKLDADYIISDRYFYDTVVNINFLSENESKLYAEKFVPKPDYAFYLRVSPEKIMQREQKPDQGIEYLKAKEKLFDSKARDWGIVVVDGGKNKDEIHSEITRELRINGAL